MKEPVEAGRPLADAIAAETARRDLTQDEAAAEVGTSQQTMGKWINGVTRPGDPFIAPLAKYLGMTEEKVRELRGPMRSDPRDRQLLRRRIDELEVKVSDLERAAEERNRRGQEMLDRLESLAERLDALAD